MDSEKVAKFLAEKHDMLFPNDTVSEEDVKKALLDAPDSFESTMVNFPFRKPDIAEKVARIGGNAALDIYMADFNKKINLFMFYRFGRGKKAGEHCRQYNCNYLISSITDPSIITKLHDQDEKVAKIISFIPTGVKLGKQILEDFQNGMEAHPW